MIKNLLKKIFRTHHYWRTVSFSEVAELYASRLMITFAIYMVSAFVAIYLYKLGYSVATILLLHAGFYLARVLFVTPSAHIIAHFGPKHSMFLASIVRVASLVSFLFVQQFGVYAIVVFGILQQCAACLDNFAYMVDFSKVKHNEHAGKELATVATLEKLARIIAPLVGGVIASLFAPQYTIAFAAILFTLATIPLLQTAEPIKQFRTQFNWRELFQSSVLRVVMARSAGMAGYGTQLVLWPLYTMIVIFTTVGDGIYIVVGLLGSLSIVMAIASAWSFGRMIDRNRGAELLAWGAAVQCLGYLSRPFVAHPFGVVAVNAVSEVAAVATDMSIIRTVFDGADTSGHRVQYVGMVEFGDSCGLLLIMLTGALMVSLFGAVIGLQIVFVLVGFYQLVMLRARAAYT